MRTTLVIPSVMIVLAALVGTCLAEIVTATGTIESIDPANRNVSVRRKTGKGDKSGTFTLSDDARIIIAGGETDLAALKAGDIIKLSYDTATKRITRIELASEKDGQKNEAMQKQDKSGGMHAHNDIAYAEPKNQRQMFDVYASADAKDCPIIFWIHGGGLDHGDKADMQLKPKAFVDRGFVFVATNYRFLPKVTTREIAGDIAKAIRWVHDHAEEYGGDPDKIFVMGYAAGALLSSLVCTDERYLKGEGLSFSIIKGCVSLECEAYDVRLRFATGDRQVKQSYTKIFGAERQQRELSPITYVAKGRQIPPFLICHVADSPEMATQAERFVKKLHAAGIPANVYPARGTDHGMLNANLGRQSDEPTTAIFDFLNNLLKSKSDSGKNGGR